MNILLKSVSASLDFGKVAISIGTILFGISVVLARDAMDYMGPYSFNALCHSFGCLVLILFRPQLKKFESMTYAEEDYDDAYYQETLGAMYIRSLYPQISESTENILNLMMFAVPYGILQFFANTLGQVGLVTIEAGKSAFLTSLYVVFTPLLQALILDNSVSKLTKWTWISAAISVVGSFCLAGISSELVVSFGTGELLTIIAAVFWACEIVIADIGSKFIDGVDLALASSCISTTISLVAAFVMEREAMLDLHHSLPLYGLKLIIWVSLLETVASVLDTIGQAYTTGYQAAVIMGLDGVVTVIFGYLYLSETLGNIEKVGCVLLLAATYLASIEETVMENEEGIEEHTFKLSTSMHERHLAMGGWPHRLLRSHTIDTEYRRRPRYYSNLEMSINSRAAPQFTSDSAVKLKKHHSFQAGDVGHVSFADELGAPSDDSPPIPSPLPLSGTLPFPLSRSRDNLALPFRSTSISPKNSDSPSRIAERYLHSYGSTENN